MGIADQLCVSKTCASGYCSIDVVEVFPGLGDHDVRPTAVGERFAKKAFAGHRPFERMLLDAEMSAEVVLREVRRTKHCTPADFPESPSSCLERIKDSLRQGSASSIDPPHRLRRCGVGPCGGLFANSCRLQGLGEREDDLNEG